MLVINKVQGGQNGCDECRIDETEFQRECDRITIACLWRRVITNSKSPLYSVRVQGRGESGFAVISHDFPVTRNVLGMPCLDTFQGNTRCAIVGGFAVYDCLPLFGWDTDFISDNEENQPGTHDLRVVWYEDVTKIGGGC